MSKSPKQSSSSSIAQVVRRVIEEHHFLRYGLCGHIAKPVVVCSCNGHFDVPVNLQNHQTAELEAAFDALLDVDEPCGGENDAKDDSTRSS